LGFWFFHDWIRGHDELYFRGYPVVDRAISLFGQKKRFLALGFCRLCFFGFAGFRLVVAFVADS